MKPESITIKNIESAFAGESMAHIKYRYFAKIARAQGDEATAKVFEDTADQEVQHAFGHLDLLYPPAELTPAMYARFDALGTYASDIGADGLLFTCSAFGDAIDAVVFDSFDVRYRLAGILPVARDEVCVDAENRRFACGLQARADRKSTRLNSSHIPLSRMPSSA